MAQVVLQNISKAYPGGVMAVDGVSLTVADQEFVVLVGPSGCGKSTTLRMIAGLETPDGGTVAIGERVVNAVPPKDRDIAMVFQNYALYPHMTVYGNMSFALRLRMLPGLLSRLLNRAKTKAIHAEIRRRVMHAADLLDIRPLMNRKPRELSGGQRQRVALGRAIVREPAAFLFDEPLSNLDARLRVTTRAELKRLHQRLRTTTVYVTHDQEEAMTLGDRIVVMKDGKIQQADTAMVTYHRPRNRFVAGFIGMPPMNFFDGVLRSVDGELVFEESAATGVTTAAAVPPTPETGAETASELTLPSKGFTISLSRLAPGVRERLGDRVGRQVVLGIRPEHLSLRPTVAGDGSVASQSLEMRVSVVEPLGSSVDLYMQTARQHAVVARVEPPAGEGPSGEYSSGHATLGFGATGLESIGVGSVATVHVDVRRAHLFEPGEAGMNLSLETSSPEQPKAELTHATA